ncbi:hypothetical protein IX51_11160 [uncultured archaeon]|nr:hypothetical protein IX51_11160 [uncultured archaeon]HKJ96332.1 TIGR00341 family protein [Thermoplasmataceae archaeon]
MKKIIVRFNEGTIEKIRTYSSEFQGISFLDASIREMVLYVNDSQLDTIMDQLNTLLDFRYKENLIEVESPDFIVSSYLDRSSEKSAGSEKTPVEKLIDQTKKYTILEYGKISLTSVAALIAMMGLFMNNDPIIIGAMLLSPMLGPIYAFAINISIGKIESALRGIAILLILLAAAVGIVFMFTALAKAVFPLPITTQIDLRLHFNSLYVPLGILLGFASMLAMGRDIPEIFAGVAISVALVPPAAVAGIMLAIDPAKAFVPFLIVAQNTLGMMTGSLLSMIMLRIGPRKYYAQATARKYLIRILIIVLILLVITLIADIIVSL